MTNAAILRFDPREGMYGAGDEFAVNLLIDINSGCVNTIEAEVLFPADRITLKSVLTGDSVVSIWVDRPSDADLASANGEGRLHLSGGIPGGYCGRIPGDPGESNIVARIVFAVPGFMVGEETDAANGPVDIRLGEGSRVFLNDGLGTADILAVQDATYLISDRAGPTQFDWDKLIRGDRIPPEPFVIELYQNPKVYENRYYIIFSTVDKQTGIDRYEVLEIKPEDEPGIAPKRSWWEKLLKDAAPAPVWVAAEMPFVLKDQTLSSIIKVKAVDKAGNERLVEYVPPYERQKPAAMPLWLMVALGGGGLLVLAIVSVLAYIIVKTIKKRKQYPHDSIDQN